MTSEPSLNRLLASDFSVEQFVLHELRGGRDVRELSELQSRMQQAKSELVSSVDASLAKNYVSLITEMQKIKEFQLNDVETGRELMIKVNRSMISLHAMFTQHYESVRDRMSLLKNAKDASMLIQKAIKYMQNLKILQNLVTKKLEISDLVKTSLILHELQIHASALQDLSFYEDVKDFVALVKDEVLKRAEKKFADALLQKNSVEISLSIQIFFHLGMLAEILEARANQSLKASNSAWKQILTREYGGEYSGAIVVQIKNQLTEDYSNAQQMWLLNQSVKASRDPASLESYETFLAGKNVLKLFELFWNKQYQVIGQSLGKLGEGQKFATNYKTIVSYYPKIFGFLENFASNFNEYVLTFPDSLISYDFAELKKRLLDALSSLSQPHFQALSIKLSSLSSKLLKNLQTSKKTSVSTLPSIVNEFETGLLAEFAIQQKENFSACALIFKQSSAMFLNEGYKLVNSLLAYFQNQANTPSIADTFNTLYVLTALKNSVMRPLLECEHNDQIDLQLYDAVSEQITSSIRYIITTHYQPSVKKIIQQFLSTFFQSDKHVFNAKAYINLQTILLNFSPYTFPAERLQGLQAQLTTSATTSSTAAPLSFESSLIIEGFNNSVKDLLRSYCFVMIFKYNSDIRTQAQESSLGEEISGMTSLLEHIRSSVQEVKVIIRLQKLLYIDWSLAKEILSADSLSNQNEFEYYLAHGILQLAVALRLEKLSGIHLIQQGNTRSIETDFDKFSEIVISNPKILVEDYININGPTLQKYPEFSILQIQDKHLDEIATVSPQQNDQIDK